MLAFGVYLDHCVYHKENEDEDQNDPSKLSLAERVSLFNEKMVTDRLAPSRPRSGSRFKTQPVTTEEVVTAQKMVPAISRAASGILGVIYKQVISSTNLTLYD